MSYTADIVAYAYEAGLHCDACALKRFPNIRTDEVEDSEGNLVSEVCRWDLEDGDSCDTCHVTLRESAPSLYRTEFPTFPAEAIPADVFGDGWDDISFRNDVCPSFAVGEFTVFVDWPDAADREWPELSRYRAYLSEDIRTDPMWTGAMCESDAWSDILTFIANGGR